MYTKLELVKIFKNCKSAAELYEVCDAFNWIVKNNFMNRSVYISRLAQLKFRELTNQNRI